MVANVMWHVFAMLFCLLMTVPVASSDSDTDDMTPDAKRMVKLYNRKAIWDLTGVNVPLNEVSDMLGGDMMVSASMARKLSNPRRKKRKSVNFEQNPDAKWDITNCITYKFKLGQYGEPEKEKIRAAIQYWMDHTCVCFNEVPPSQAVQGPHIQFALGSGCLSFVGMAEIFPQNIYLQSDCLLVFGLAVHEIGHAIGLIHEHQRHDRYLYVRINTANIKDEEISNFAVLGEDFADTKGPNQMQYPYDYGSIMQYDGLAFSNFSDQFTMESIDPLFQSTMGQRVEASYWDFRAVNDDYCSATCPTKLACQNQGYTDPKDCNKCRCPDGFSGKFCTDIQSAVGTPCGGELQATYTENFVTTPGYNWGSSYNSGQECTWKITSTNGGNIRLNFASSLGVYKHGEACYEWSEIRYKQPMHTSGPRFCGTDTPSTVLVSDSNTVMVLFRAKWTGAVSPGERRGFKLAFQEVNSCDGVICQHGGSCNPSNPSQCSCLAGWSGNRCQTNIDDCNPNPCLNGGACQDLVNAYQCTCTGGYTGKHCQTAPPAGNGCSTNPCENGATCTNTATGFTCTCAMGFYGDTCALRGYCGGCGQKPGCIVGQCEDKSQLTGGTCTRLQRNKELRTRTISGGWWLARYRRTIRYWVVTYSQVQFDCYKKWCCDNAEEIQTRHGVACAVVGSYWTPCCPVLCEKSHLITYYKDGNRLRWRHDASKCCTNNPYARCNQPEGSRGRRRRPGK